MNLVEDWTAKAGQFTSGLLQRVASVPSDVALYISCLPAIEQKVLYPHYQTFLQHHKPDLPELSTQDLEIARTLATKGICITSLDALQLPHTDNFLAAAQNLSDELAQMAALPKYKGKHTLTATAEQIMHYPDIFLWGAQERLLRIAEHYLKLPVAYDGLSYYFSIANGLEAGPRKWHRDKEDWHMIKVGVYLNDVDSLGGPFECVTPEANIKICKQAKQRYQIFRDNELKGFLREDPQTWRTSCIGSRGTVIFVDTAHYYHRGRPPVTQDRSAIFFGYFSLRPKHPFFCGRSPLSHYQLEQLSQSLPSEIRESILWKNRLPGIGRWIPKNYLKV
jgi:hypothetical protein